MSNWPPQATKKNLGEWGSSPSCPSVLGWECDSACLEDGTTDQPSTPPLDEAHCDEGQLPWGPEFISPLPPPDVGSSLPQAGTRGKRYERRGRLSGISRPKWSREPPGRACTERDLRISGLTSLRNEIASRAINRDPGTGDGEGVATQSAEPHSPPRSTLFRVVGTRLGGAIRKENIARVYCPRGRYLGGGSSTQNVGGGGGGSKWTEERRERQARAIREGHDSTPSVVGSKRTIVRACVLAMLNAQGRGLPSPVRHLERLPAGEVFAVEEPMRMVSAMLESLRAFGRQPGPKSRGWEEYIASILSVASRRLQGVGMEPSEMKGWRSFVTVLRSAEICPIGLSGESYSTLTRYGAVKDHVRKRKGPDWLHETVWFIAHDVVGGMKLDYRSWNGECVGVDVGGEGGGGASGADRVAALAMQETPYASKYVEAIPGIIEACMRGVGGGAT